VGIHTGFWWENLKVNVHWEDLDEYGSSVVKWSLKKENGSGLDWIDLTRDRDRWLAVVTTVMGPRIA